MKKVNSFRIGLSILAVMVMMTLVPTGKAFSTFSSSVRTISEATVIEDSVVFGEWKYYAIHNTWKDILFVELQDLSGNVDLYLYEANSRNYKYSCRSARSGTSDEFCWANKFTTGSYSGVSYYIGVHGRQGGSYKLNANLENLFQPKEIMGKGFSGASVRQGEWRHYQIDVPAYSELRAVIPWMSGDVDLYVRKGQMPTISVYDCRPWYGGTRLEECTFTPKVKTTYYISVYGWASGTSYFNLGVPIDLGLPPFAVLQQYGGFELFR